MTRETRRTRHTHLAWAMLTICSCCMTVSAENLLPNPGFEGDFGDDGIAEGWADNSTWGDLDVEYARDSQNPHSGNACQRIICRRLDRGAVQMVPLAPARIAKGQVYRVRGWLRGNVGTVALQLRLTPAPYSVYAEDALRVTQDWQELDYLWTATVDDPNARFMLRFTQIGTLWVDDLSVEESTPEEAARLALSPEPGNLLHNGGFDLDLANWLLHHGCDCWEEAKLDIERTELGPCLKLTVPAGVRAVLSSDVARITPGRPLQICCRLRASAPTSVAFLSSHCGTRADVTDTWQPIVASGEVGFSPVRHDHVLFVVSGPAALWIDDVSLRQDGLLGADQSRPGLAPPDRPRAAIMSDQAHHPTGLYLEPEEPKLRLLSLIPPPAPVLLNWRVEDFWGKTVLSGRRESPPGRAHEPISCRGLPRGWYRATVTWTHQGREYGNECTFCVLPPPTRSADIATSPFGAHFALDPTSIKLARAVGCRWLRLHPPNHTKWRVVEPKEGEWAWRDEPIRTACQAGLELVGSLDRCPNWASIAPEGTPLGGFYTGIGAWLPRNWSQWERYVSETVRRHKDDIRIWEVWNEPNLTDWLRPREGQTRAEAYVEMLRHTYPIVKREDPAATVIGGCVAGAMTEGSSAWQFAQDIIEFGALHLMDVFSFHEYITKPVDEGRDPIQTWLPRLREKMRAAGRELPIINSEGGYANPGTSITYRPATHVTVPPDKMARWLVRQHVAQIAVGIRQFYFYNFFIDGLPVVHRWEGFLEGDGQPLPNVAAYATMTWLLDGAEFDHTLRPTEDLWLHHFRTPRGPMVVAWSRTETEAQQTMPNATRAWDLMGAEIELAKDARLTISDAPTYLLLSP